MALTFSSTESLAPTKTFINVSDFTDSSQNNSASTSVFPTEDPYCHLFGGDQHKCVGCFCFLTKFLLGYCKSFNNIHGIFLHILSFLPIS